MPNIRFDAKARSFAKQTGLDKLGQETLKKLDRNGDGVVTVTDAKEIARKAGLDKDGVLSRDDRKRIGEALGDSARTSSTASSGPSSVVAARAGATKAVGDTYMQFSIDHTAGGLKLAMTGDFWNDDGRTDVGLKNEVVLKGLKAASHDVLFYATDGATGLSRAGGSEGGSAHAAGMLVAVADKERGIVLVDVSGRDFLKGKAPPEKELLSTAQLASNPVVKQAAKKAGLDPKSLEVQLKELHLSYGDDDRKNHLAFTMKVKDQNGKSKTLKLSTFIEGNLAKSPSRLKADDLQVGFEWAGGRVFPPSEAPEKVRGFSDEGGDSTIPSDRGGGSESSSTRPRTNRGGGGESSHLNSRSWNSSAWSGWPSSGGGGGGGE